MSEPGKVFIDTNVLVYSADANAPAKQKRAREMLRKAEEDANGVISTQVLQEFYVTATRKLSIEPLMAKGMLNTFATLELVVVDFPLIKEAADCSVLEQLSFRDALIVVSAQKANCGVLWTEDLNHGQNIRGVTIHNPLKK